MAIFASLGSVVPQIDANGSSIPWRASKEITDVYAGSVHKDAANALPEFRQWRIFRR
ncbi:hypothetical protein ABQE45_18160 [Mycobacteroides chelonae]